MAIVVVDYDMGNVGSIVNMMKKIGHAVDVSSAPDVIHKADRLILPGVGSFDVGMENIRARGLADVLTEKVIGRRTPVLGICLGMQLLGESSQEGGSAGLGRQYYGGKHYESIYTRFYQGYILPKKFGFDKRKMHPSSLVCSGEITRDEALAKLQKPPYSEDLQASDREYVVKKLGITDEEFERIMRTPPKRFEYYPNYENSRFVRIARRVRSRLPFR